MQDRQKWSYSIMNSSFATNLEEFNQRQSKNDYAVPGNNDPILKPVIHLGFVTSDKERGIIINLRVSCYLNDDQEKSFKIFTSLSADNIATFEYFKKDLNELWVDVTYKQVSDNKFFTYVETKELFEKEKIEYFIAKINKYYHLPPDLYQEFRIAAQLPPVVLDSRLTISQKKHENLKPTHEQNELCNLIFTDSHFDATVWKIIKKISPKLKSLGYNCFFNEAPETTTLNDFIENQKMYIQQRIDTNIIILKLRADLGKLPKECFYENEEYLMAARAYFAKSASIECLQNFVMLNLGYTGIDLKEVLDTSAYDHMASDEGIAKRNHKMASAYLTSSNPVFGLIGYKHALGLQHEILSLLPLHEAKKKFRFIHVYSELPLDEYETDLQAGKISYPLGLTLINAKEMSEDKIIEVILEAMLPKQKPFNSAIQNLSIFYNHEICTTPTSPTEKVEWNAINTNTASNEFQQAGPGYGF